MPETRYPTESLEEFMDARETARVADTVGDESERIIKRAKSKLKVEIEDHPELSDLEKAGWLISLDNEEPAAAAEEAIKRLAHVQELVSHENTPVVFADLGYRKRDIELHMTDGTGLTFGRTSSIAPMKANIGFKGSNPSETFTYLNAIDVKLVADAVVEPEEVQGLDTTSHHTTAYTPENSESALIIGEASIRAYLLRLLDQEESKRRNDESYLIEAILWQAHEHELDLTSSSERLMVWREKMRAERLDMVVKSLLNKAASALYEKPLQASKNSLRRWMKLYGISYEEVRSIALEVHNDLAAQTRERLESIESPFDSESNDSLNL